MQNVLTKFAIWSLLLKGWISDDEFTALPAHKKRCRYFQQSKNLECHSELLKIAQFFFAVAPHNANVERIFFTDAESVDKRKKQDDCWYN